jgi:hypothetical protein
VATGVELVVSASEYAEDVVAKLVTRMEWVPLGVAALAVAVNTVEFEELAAMSVN